MWRMWLVTAVAVLIAASVVVGWAAKLTVNGGTLQVFTFPVDLGPVAATIDIDPDTLNPDSQGNFVMAYVELPEGYDVADIDVSTVTLEVGGVDNSVPAAPSPTAVGDEDGDGIPDRMVKFSREAVVVLLDGRTVDITFRVKGQVSGSPFEGTDTIQLLASQGSAEDAQPAAPQEPPPPPSAPPAPNQTATPAPTATIGPSPSPTPVATASPTPVPTASPTPSASPVPAPGGIYVSVTCQGQPVAGAQVRVSHQFPGETVVWSGGTGDDGELSTGLVLNAGTYLVDIVKQGASYDSVIATVSAGAYAPVYAQCTAEWGTGYRN